MTTPIFLCTQKNEIPAKRKMIGMMNMMGFSRVIYRTRLCNDMSTYDTYGHTYCSINNRVFICSGITNGTRNYV